MENLDDDEIQRLIEEQLCGHESPAREKYEDDDLYRLLFAELGNPPSNREDAQLAERVVNQIERKQERIERIVDALFICAVCLLTSGVSFLALSLTNTDLSSAISQFLVANRSVGFYIVGAYCAIQLLDRTILKERQKRTLFEGPCID
jgi:hypothetical protein